MSQWILKCTICGGDHSIFQCENKCGVCHGNNCQYSCSKRPPQRKKRKTQLKPPLSPLMHQATKSFVSSDNLLKKHEKVGQAFQNQQQQLTTDLGEREKECDAAHKDAEELADLCHTKEEVVKNLQTGLLQAKKIIAVTSDYVNYYFCCCCCIVLPCLHAVIFSRILYRSFSPK